MEKTQSVIAQSDATLNTSFAADIKKGLLSNPKSLPSKYFYDGKGDLLFRQIMQLDEYYLTRCEAKIIEASKAKLLRYFGGNQQAFDLIELGAGDGAKTKILLQHFLEQEASFHYLSIDISSNALSNLSQELETNFKGLKHISLCGEYMEKLFELRRLQNKKALLFLGSNIGNFTYFEAIDFFKSIRGCLSSGDCLLTGFDLKKDPEIILKAYDDRHGITSRFNFNLLERINRELGGNFSIDNFKHYPLYDPAKGEARSYLISLKTQEVFIKAIGERFYFEPWEAIHTEVSKKYDMEQIQAFAEVSSFRVVDNFFDENRYFVDSLWIAE